MNDRIARIRSIKERRELRQAKLRDEIGSLFDSKISDLQETLDSGIEINNIDEFSAQLDKFKLEAPDTSKLEHALSNFKMPDVPKSVKIEGLEKLLSKIEPPKQGSYQIIGGKTVINGIKDEVLIPAQGVGTKLMITDLVVVSCLDMHSEVDVKDGNKTKMTYPAPGLGGAVHSLNTPFELSDNTPLKVSINVMGAKVKVSALGYVV